MTRGLLDACRRVHQTVYIHVAGDDVGVIVFLHDLRFLVLIADFAYNFFYQVFDGHQAGYATVFIHDDRHADVTALHFAQQSHLLTCFPGQSKRPFA